MSSSSSSNWLQKAELTASVRPILYPTELETYLISSVDIEPDFEPQQQQQQSPNLKSGLLTLTTHRLIFIPSQNYAVFIPLSLITHIHALKKSLKSFLSISSPRVRFDLNQVDPVGPGSVTVVMRGKADNHELLGVWRGRVWESVNSGGGLVSSSSGSSVAIKVPVVGLAGILRKEQEMWESTDKSLQDAFQDLNALMSKAREMVMLAEKTRQKLLAGASSHSGAANDEEMGSKEGIQDWLLSVGIISPVTKESAGALYHQQLSRQCE